MSQDDAIGRVLDIVRDSVAFAPTTVVWLVDVSPSAMDWGSEIHSAVRAFYEKDVPALVEQAADRLQTGVLAVGQTVEFRVKLTADAQQVVTAWDELRIESTGREATFQAVEQALAAYLPSRIREHREVMFVIITDEAGDDWRQVDRLIEQPRTYALPVYVIGVPAPLGQTAALEASVESSSGDEVGRTSAATPEAWQPILQGPESRDRELIQLELEDVHSELELLDSGFGPFALEWLCRESGGTFLAVRRASMGSLVAGPRRQRWPTVEMGAFDRRTMRKYVPDWRDEAAYQAVWQGNAACQALHAAAQLPRAAVLRGAEYRFEKLEEAELKNRLDRAQQAAARVAPAVDQLYEVLRQGVDAADQLTRPRWHAAYHLAMGRAAAAKARIDGYNSMLAALKRGRSFTQQDSRFWVLERAETTAENSALENLIGRARAHLQRVVDEHPGTPWAKIAQYELAIPMGWRWIEER